MATILEAGATGKLGKRIVRELIKGNAVVKAIVRDGTKQEDSNRLKGLGATIVPVDFSKDSLLIAACMNVDCVVFAMAGFRDTIIDAQSLLLEAALAAGIPRFIPSDYCVDFTNLPEAENRNFDLRKGFHSMLGKSHIAATSIFNGAFTDILGYGTPVYNAKNNSIAYWGSNPDWKMDFTTMDNTAAFTAAAALDQKTPRYLRIASFQISAAELQALAEQRTGRKFTLTPMGSLDEFAKPIKQQRAADPAGENKLYPQWENSQYIHSMFSAHNETLDNQRYHGIKWSTAETIIENI